MSTMMRTAQASAQLVRFRGLCPTTAVVPLSKSVPAPFTSAGMSVRSDILELSARARRALSPGDAEMQDQQGTYVATIVATFAAAGAYPGVMRVPRRNVGALR